MKVSSSPKLKAAAFAVALCTAFVAGCGKDKPEKLVGSAKEYIAQKDYKASVSYTHLTLPTN